MTRYVLLVHLGDGASRWAMPPSVLSAGLTRQRHEAREWRNADDAATWARAHVGSPWEVVPA